MQRTERTTFENTLGPLTAGGIRQSMFTLVSTAMGGGVLCLPFAMMEAGWLLGSILLLMSATIAFFSMSMLIESANKTRKFSYAGLLAHVMGAWTAPALDLVMILYGIGAIIAYFMFLGDFIPPLIETIGLGVIDRRLAIVACLVMSIPLTIPEKLSALKYVSPVSTLSLLFTALLVIFRSSNNHAVSDMVFEPVIIGPQLLRSFSICLFAFVCHLNVVSVAGELVEPTPPRIFKVAGRVSGLLFSFYLLIGVLGYYSFGSGISQNFMNSFPTDDRLAIFAKLTLTLSLFFCLPINANPTGHAIVHFSIATDLAPAPREIEGPLLTEGEPLRGLRLGGSAGVLGVAALVACLIPGVADVVGILGGSLGNLLMMVCPAIIYAGIFKEISFLRKCALGLMATASAVSFLGVFFSVYKLVY